MNNAAYDLRNQLTRRIAEMELERSSWIPHWRELSQVLLPRSGRFLLSDRNNGAKRHNSIYDSTATRALRVLGAGLMSGATSPARPWFRLATADKALMKDDSVKMWLSEVTRELLAVFAVSNTYRSLHRIYEEMGAFGVGATIIMDDFQSVMHHHTLTVGEYSLAANWRGDVDTLSRTFETSVENVVREFGYDKCSGFVKNNYDRGNYGVWVPVCHIIEPRHERDVTKRDSKNMPFRSVYFEQGSSADHMLRESGMKQFRALTPRWDVTGYDVYSAACPGIDSLGDIKQLQHQQLKKGTAIDYQVEPPIQLPTMYRDQPQKRLPGGEYYVDATGPGMGIRSAWEVNLNLQALREDIVDVRARINEGFYKDLFLMLSSQAALQGKLTATQVAEIHEEKLLMLGPTTERLHNELLQKMVDMGFERLVEIGKLPPIPEALNGVDLNIEFVSILAQAQRAVATNSVDRFVVNLGQVATFKPGVLDKFNEDEWADAYADMLGVDPSLIVPDDQVALIRKQKAQAAQAQQQAAMMNQAADTAGKLGSINTSEPNALTNIMTGLQGYGTPGPEAGQ